MIKTLNQVIKEVVNFHDQHFIFILFGKLSGYKWERVCMDTINAYGIIAVTRDEGGNLRYLVLKRRDTFEYTDFVRGFWTREADILNMFGRMTAKEKYRIRNYVFDELWEDMWVDKTFRVYIDGYNHSKKKYEMAKKYIVKALETSPTTIVDTEWEFPKGKKATYKENPLRCALREFEEETTIPVDEVIVSSEAPDYCERFYGTNNKVYVNNYFVGNVRTTIHIPVKSIDGIRKETVSAEAEELRWVTLEEARGMLSEARFDMLEKIQETYIGE